MARRTHATWRILGAAAGLAIAALSGCGASEQEVPPPPEPAAAAEPEDAEARALAERAGAALGVLPETAAAPDRPLTNERIALGRMLYYENRISKAHDISCNSCHQLDAYGVDGEPTSPGHEGQRGERNSPTVYNAALHIAQFWDGRAEDVEEQAKGPIMNPVEMAMGSETDVLAVIGSIPDYGPLFTAAFPEAEGDAISFDNMAIAIGAFERKLMTPGPFDAFLEGDLDALSADAQAGLELFLDVGCITCHTGPTVGGQMYQKMGLVEPYELEDTGRHEVTGNEADMYVFKVPSLRNVAETGPWLHDGIVTDLDEVIRIMGKHQLGRELDAEQVRLLRAFLESLTGRIPEGYIARPEMPQSGPDTPQPSAG